MKPRLATVWLVGCSGCHMSVLDMDERILEVLAEMDLVYSPLVDHKVFPEGVDVTLVEGSVSNEDDQHKIRLVRDRTKVLVALGDCAVTSNVPGMRNPWLVKDVLGRAYTENADGPRKGETPATGVPRLLPWVRPSTRSSGWTCSCQGARRRPTSSTRCWPRSGTRAPRRRRCG